MCVSMYGAHFFYPIRPTPLCFQGVYPQNPNKAMEILFNQQPLQVSATNLLALSSELQLPTSGIAVAVNNRLVPRTQWQDFLLQDGMSILVIKAVCGG